jgi:hypothetical protein
MEIIITIIRSEAAMKTFSQKKLCERVVQHFSKFGSQNYLKAWCCLDYQLRMRQHLTEPSKVSLLHKSFTRFFQDEKLVKLLM